MRILTQTVFVCSFIAFCLAGCASKNKASDASASAGATTANSAGKAATTSESELLERYDLSDLNTVATALRIIFEKKTSEGAQDDQVLGCPINADQARKLSDSLKNLMEAQMDRERESYIQDPGVYSRSHGLETCGAKCACGALVGVLKPVSAKSLKLPNQRVAHDRAVKRLESKASRQSADESLSCARKANWFCSSDLRAFLEKQSNLP